MSLSVGDLVATLSLDDTFSGGLGRAVDAATEAGSAITDALGGIPAIATGAFAAIGAGVAVVAGLTAAVVALGERGSDVQDITENFDALTASMGLAAGVGIGALRTGTQGLVSDFDLMQGANKAMSAGFQASASDLTTIGEAAVILSKRVGLEGGAASAYEELMSAMTTGRPKALAQLGVIVDMTTATDALGGSTKVAAGGAQTAAAVDEKRAGIMRQLVTVVQQAGAQELTFADRVTQAKIGVANFTDALSKAVAESPAVNIALQAIDAAMLQAFGVDQANTIKTITGYVDDFVIMIVTGTSYAVTGVKYLLVGYDKWKQANDIIDISNDEMVLGISLVTQAVLKGAEVATGYSSTAVVAYEAVTADIAKQKTTLGQHATALAQDMVAANNTWNTMSGWSKTLDDLAAKMKAATGQTVEQSAAVRQLKKDTGDAGDAAAEIAAKIAAWEKSTGLLDVEIGNATSAGEDLDQVTLEFGKQAHDAAAEAVKLGIPLAAIPGNVDSINNAFNRSVIQTALDKLNASSLKLGTSFLDAQGKADTLAADDAWKQLKAGVTELDTISTQWTNDFSSGVDLATIKAKSFHDQALVQLSVALSNGSINATQFAVALHQVDDIEGKMVDDAKFAQMQQQISGVSSSLSTLSSDFTGTAASILKGASTSVAGFGQMDKGLQEMNTSGGSLTKTLEGATTALTGVFGIGVTLGSFLSSVLSHAIDDTDTAIKNLGADVLDFSPWAPSAMQTANSQLGQLQGTAVATQPVLDDLFKNITAGGADAAAPLATLNALVTTLAGQATTTGGVWSTELQGLIAQSDKLGLSVTSINTALATQRSNAMGGLTTSLGVTSAAYTAASTDQTSLATDQATLADPTATASAVAKAQQDIQSLNADLATQQGIISATQIGSQQQMTAVTDSVEGLIAANVKAGESFIQATKDAAPAITSLQQQITATVFSGGTAFTFLSDEAKLASGAISGPALTSVEGYTAAVQGLANTGLLTKTSFSGLESQIGSTYQTLIQQGATGQEALAALQPDLQTAWQLEQQYGYTTDAATQSLIAQGVAAGTVGEQQKDPMNQMIDAMNGVKDDLDQIVDKLTGKGGLVDAAQTAASGMQNAFDGITGPTIDVTYKTSDVTSGAPAPPLDESDWTGPIGDAPLTAVQEPGPVWLKRGDIYGMPALTPGFASTPLAGGGAAAAGGAGGATQVTFDFSGIQISGIDGPSLERSAKTLATIVVDKITSSGALQTALVNRGVKPVLGQQGLI